MKKQKEFIQAILENLEQEILFGNSIETYLVIFTSDDFTIVKHECSYLAIDTMSYGFYYSITGDFYFFEGSVPWGGGACRYLYKLRKDLLPEEIKSKLREVANTLKGKVIPSTRAPLPIGDFWTKP